MAVAAFLYNPSSERLQKIGYTLSATLNCILNSSLSGILIYSFNKAMHLLTSRTKFDNLILVALKSFLLTEITFATC